MNYTESRLDEPKPMKKLTLASLTGLYCAIMTALPAFASDNVDTNAITQGITQGTGQVWNILVAVVAPIAAIALAVCAFNIILGGQRAAEQAKSTAIKIIIGIAIVLLAPSLIQAVKGWFTASSWNF